MDEHGQPPPVLLERAGKRLLVAGFGLFQQRESRGRRFHRDLRNMIREIGVEVSVGHLREPPATPPPFVCLWLLRAFAWLAPADGRAEWNTRWSSRLWNLWVLVERGELAARASTETALLCRDAIAAAFWMRFNRASLRHWLHGPMSLLS